MFEQRLLRKGVGALKWEDMYEYNANVPDEIVPLSVADMEFLSPPEITAGLKTFLDTMPLGYTISTKQYYQTVAAWMAKRHGWSVDPSWILEYPGVINIIYDAVRTMTQPGDGVIIMPPVYPPFFDVVQNTERKLVENCLILDETGYHIDFKDLEQKVKDPANKLLILCNPHNPVGRLWTREELTQIGRLCISNDVLIVSDEIHSEIVMPGKTHTVFASISDEFAAHCVTCTSPSKSFNVPGLQLANAIISSPEIREAMASFQIKSGFTMLNALSYKACEIAYTSCGYWLDQMLSVIAKNRDWVVSYILEQMPIIKPAQMEATYLLWLDCRGLGMDNQTLERFMKDEANLFFSEGYTFGRSGSGFERVNLACPLSVLQAAFGRLHDALVRLGIPMH